MKRILGFGLLTLLVVLGIAPQAGATFPGGVGLIAYSDQSAGNREIYTAYFSSVDGSLEHRTRLTNDSLSDTDPAWSPDGSKIAFVSDRDGNSEIYVMDADGANQTRITDNAGDDLDPAWSPDGTRLAIRRNIEGNNEIVLIDAVDGGNPVNLTDDPASDFNPDFSPDGTKITFQRFTSGAGTGFGNEVMLMNADGTGQENLTANENTINDGEPSFSPDGNEIVFHSNRSEGTFGLYRLTLEDSAIEPVGGATDEQYREPVFSPDGTMIASSSDRLPAVGSGALAVAVLPETSTSVSAFTEVATPNWQPDDRAPAATITAPGESETIADATPSIEFSADEAGASFECAIGEAEFTTCSSPHEPAELTDGEHTFRLRTTDLAGNVSEPVTRSFTVDTTAPVATITAAPAPITADDTPEFAFSSNEPLAAAECSWDGADWESCSSPVTSGPLAEGPHTFSVRVSDALNHWSEPATFDWVIETTPPTVAITSTPEDPTAEPNAWFSFESPTSSAGFECRLDPGAETPWTPCVSGVGYENLTDGTHRFQVRAVGQGAGPGSPVEMSWTIDTVAPRLGLTVAPSSPTNLTTGSFAFEMNKPGFSFVCQLDDEPAAPCASPVQTTVAPGDHSMLITALDGEGESVDSILHNWTVLANPPVATVTAAPAGVVPTRSSAVFFEADLPETVFECSFDQGAWISCTSPAVHNASADGPARIDVRAKLPGELNGPAVSREWQVDSLVPTVTISGGPNGRGKESGASFGIASDDQNAELSCRVDEGAWQDCGGNLELTGLADGAHVLRVAATDEAGNTGWARRDWSVDTTGPVTGIASGPDRSTINRKARFSFSASEGNSSFECRLDSGVWATCASPHQIGYLELGAHRFEVRATDDLGNPGEPALHEWTVALPAPKGIAPTMKQFSRAAVNGRGMARIAIVGCPEGRCRVTAPHRVAYRLKGRKFTPGIRSPRGFYRERNSEIMLTMSPGARKFLRKHGPVQVKLRLKVESENGRRVVRNLRVTLRAR